MKVYLKPANEDKIFDFAKNNNLDNIQGSKLFALLRLMDTKGELITSNDAKLAGLKALPIKDKYFVCCRKTTFKNGTFALHTHLLEIE